MDLLFLGNSYTFTHPLDPLTAALLAEGATDDTPVTAAALAEPGYRWRDHATQAAVPGSAWEAALGSAPPPYTWIILQEQSQIPGFPDDSPDWLDSLDAGGWLNDRAAAQGASTLLLMTWGRRDGDASNPDLYPSFSAMQARLTAGYLTYQATFSTPERPVYVAPAGLAFQAVFNAEAEAGGDPLSSSSRFWALYEPDGSHPSLQGAYLTSCVLYASLTGRSPEGLSLPDGLDATAGAYLQGVAADVVLEDSEGSGLLYPWSGSDTGTDTGSDTGTDTDTGAGSDTDTASEDTQAGTPFEGSDDKGGRGCSGAPLPALLLLLRRKRAG